MRGAPRATQDIDVTVHVARDELALGQVFLQNTEHLGGPQVLVDAVMPLVGLQARKLGVQVQARLHHGSQIIQCQTGVKRVDAHIKRCRALVTLCGDKGGGHLASQRLVGWGHRILKINDQGVGSACQTLGHFSVAVRGDKKHGTPVGHYTPPTSE